MAAITASLVKDLRQRTGIGMMDCKKALLESDGDIDDAIEILRKNSGLKAAKKAGRSATDGLVKVIVSDDRQSAAMVEVNCETDFAARHEDFSGFVETVTAEIFASQETDIDKLLAAGLEKERQVLVQKIGENTTIRRAESISVESGQIGVYVHNGKIGVLVVLRGGDQVLGRDIAMHIAAANPLVVSPDDAPEETVAREREIYIAQAEASGKPQEIVEKMVEGRVRKYLAEISLLDQPFVKDPDQKVSALLKAADASIDSFVRYEVGEGM
jgi:elongation factor Ts|tara:strand:- start:17063 stop:17875 length:813 start_codon:yes stop_codon:yes gene_type:complete